jgi:hypothetical protein
VRKREKYGVMINVRNILVSQTEVRTFKRRMHRYEDNIKTGLKKISCKVVKWVYQILHRELQQGFVVTAMNLRVTSKVENIMDN